MGRKTVDVEMLITMVNGICKDSEPGAKDVRQGAMNVLEAVLHRTGNYKGFRYLITGECAGVPGVNYKDGQLVDFPERFENTDRTRVQY
jgi:hypothetical protein